MARLNIQFAAPQADWQDYAPHLQSAFHEAGIEVALQQSFAKPETVDYLIFAPSGPVSDFTPFTRARAVLGLWAGVETIVSNPTLTQPLTRMIDPGLTEGMVEWVVGNVLRHHLGLDRHILHQDGEWRDTPPPLARDRHVSILGLGALGSACAQALRALNFTVSGWSQRPKDVAGVRCLTGEDGLEQALSCADFLVLLLPQTPQTTHVLNAKTLTQLPDGAVVLNPGRGPLIDDAALLAALDSGKVSHATLDVFDSEPLPGDHPFWAHPKVTVSPHIASHTRPATAARTIVENIKRDQAGLPLQAMVDRARGY